MFNCNRRFFLRSAMTAGVLLPLPFLESHAWVTKRGFRPLGRTLASSRFAIFVRQGNGVQQKNGPGNPPPVGQEPDRFWPSKLGPLTRDSMLADTERSTSELADYAAKLLLVRGCELPFPGYGCVHDIAALQALTAAEQVDVEQGIMANGESIDWRIARAIQGDMGEPINLYAGAKGGYLDDVLSYRGPKDRIAAENVPFNAYRRIFGIPGEDADPQLAKQTQVRKSVNDILRSEIKALMSRPELAKSDVGRLQLHFDAIRDIEHKNGCHLPQDKFEAIQNQAAEGDSEWKITRMMMEIMALAASCGLGSAMTLQIGSGVDQTQYVVDGVRLERYHHITHRIHGDFEEGDPVADALDKHHSIDRQFARAFKYLLDQLASYESVDGPLIDQGVAVWLNDVATGREHRHMNLPYVCAGSAGGFLKNGVFIDAGDVDQERYVPHNKFLNTIAAAVGVKNAQGEPLDDFGDPTLEKGQIPGMMA